ncbi:hypothetical protein CRG98_043488 [Punica granatum]|uniref:Uncharacterized protein n=1 Tax=Punica granatum TaxID=22663 RepID=A0A2I0HWM7_PUNGR|nr:hypothetical protein CRG98_043488 [Punica granatum]
MLSLESRHKRVLATKLHWSLLMGLSGRLLRGSCKSCHQKLRHPCPHPLHRSTTSSACCLLLSATSSAHPRFSVTTDSGLSLSPSHRQLFSPNAPREEEGRRRRERERRKGEDGTVEAGGGREVATI